MGFGERFKSLLEQRNISQKDFANKFGLHTGQVSRILNGENPSSTFIMAAVNFFPKDVYFLFFGADEQALNEPGSDYEKPHNPIQIILEIEEKLKLLRDTLPQ
jgi:transcriptional regulator with XRE-family HTH domain